MSRQDHLRKLIINHTRRMQILKEQQALAGRSVEPAIIMEIEDIEQIVDNLQTELAESEPDPTHTSTHPIQASGADNASNSQPARVLVPDDQQPTKYRGLMVIVGTGRPGEDPLSQSAGLAIDYHTANRPGERGLEVCWLICSGGQHGSLDVAQTLQAICKERGLQAYLRPIGDPFSVQDSYNLIQRIYTDEVPDVGLNEAEVIADFTGGTKPMSAGMILACGERRSMQYMTGRKVGIASVPQLIRFTPANPSQKRDI
jgi:hypothetical protein